jgi:hypothetical protein
MTKRDSKSLDAFFPLPRDARERVPSRSEGGRGRKGKDETFQK